MSQGERRPGASRPRWIGSASKAARRCSRAGGPTLSSGAGVSRLHRSQRRPVPLPLRLQILQKDDEVRVVPDVVEIGVSRKVRVARPTALRRLPQPVHGAGWLVQQGVYRRDVVGGVMKMDETLALLDGGP